MNLDNTIIKPCYRVILATLFCLPSLLMAQDDLAIGIRAIGFASGEQNAFWLRSNTYGRIGQETYGLGILSGAYGKYINDNWRVTAGASAFGQLNSEPEGSDFEFNQYYAGISWKKLELKAGAWQRPEQFLDLSASGGNIIWSNNTLPFPGLVLQTNEPINIIGKFSVEGAYGNYWLGTNGPVEDVKLHYKEFTMHLGIGSGGRFSFGVHHYVQWGGTNPVSGVQQPQGIEDYFRVVLGQEGGDNATSSDQRNKLGNHVGSYKVGYLQNIGDSYIQFYYQSLVEDETGVDGRNFPDGSWGLYFMKKEQEWVQGIVYEYIQTTWQGGPNEISGGNDNYFNYGVYRDGWTYRNEVIGLPFFLPLPGGRPGVDNNVFTAHHLGIGGGKGALSYRLKMSLVNNYGTKRIPFPKEQVLYSGVELRFETEKAGTFELLLGGDLSDLNEDRFTAGLGYRYKILKGCRAYDCPDLEQTLN